ncbi:MAG: class I SAM-dependent DNA methyltransferase [Lachnospiraceae bacterium]
MEAYTDFALVYDTFMDQTPYEKWCQRLNGIMEEYGLGKGLVLELGCGTGALTEGLAELGYDMIGVDSSEAMLNVALEKRSRSGRDILYLLQDMREFELYGTVTAVVSVCDCLNYLLEEKELIQTFRLVNNYLDPGGLFLFDFNTVYKYQEIIGERTIAENREDCSFIWENYYDEEQQLNEYELTIFVKNREGLFQRFQENHLQRGYTLPRIRQCLETAGLEFLQAFDEEGGSVRKTSERIFCIAREKGKSRGKRKKEDR